MFFSIDPHSGVAIYEQIVRQVKFAIAEGTLEPGQMVPSTRALSQQLTINPNTIARAMQQLQSEGILESLRGRGMVVMADALKKCREERKEIIATRLRQILREGLHAGLSARELRQLISEELKELDGTVPSVATEPDVSGRSQALGNRRTIVPIVHKTLGSTRMVCTNQMLLHKTPEGLRPAAMKNRRTIVPIGHETLATTRRFV